MRRQAIIIAALAVSAFAQEKKDAPRITAIAPLAVVAGAEVTLKFRGMKLDGATEVRFPAHPALKTELKEKKKADVPNGLDAKDVGDTQCEAKLTLPADVPPGALAVEIVTPGGAVAHELRVIAVALAEEKEPNDGFREAQTVELGRAVRGKIGGDKDVDVFAFTAKAGQKLAVEIFSARAQSLLDPLATLYDERGRVLKVCDDSAGRDPVFDFTAPADGKYLIAIQDAHDRGGGWHNYELTVKEAK